MRPKRILNRHCEPAKPKDTSSLNLFSLRSELDISLACSWYHEWVHAHTMVVTRGAFHHYLSIANNTTIMMKVHQRPTQINTAAATTIAARSAFAQPVWTAVSGMWYNYETETNPHHRFDAPSFYRPQPPYPTTQQRCQLYLTLFFLSVLWQWLWLKTCTIVVWAQICSVSLRIAICIALALLPLWLFDLHICTWCTIFVDIVEMIVSSVLGVDGFIEASISVLIVSSLPWCQCQSIRASSRVYPHKPMVCTLLVAGYLSSCISCATTLQIGAGYLFVERLVIRREHGGACKWLRLTHWFHLLRSHPHWYCWPMLLHDWVKYLYMRWRGIGCLGWCGRDCQLLCEVLFTLLFEGNISHAYWNLEWCNLS